MVPPCGAMQSPASGARNMPWLVCWDGSTRARHCESCANPARKTVSCTLYKRERTKLVAVASMGCRRRRGTLAEADGNRTRQDCVAALLIGFEVRARHQRGERFREDSTADPGSSGDELSRRASDDLVDGEPFWTADHERDRVGDRMGLARAGARNEQLHALPV